MKRLSLIAAVLKEITFNFYPFDEFFVIVRYDLSENRAVPAETAR